MSATLRISICDPNETTRDNLKKYLIGMDQAWLEADCSRYEFFREVVEQTNPDVAIVNIDSDHDSGLQLITGLSTQFPECGIIAVSSHTEGQLILRAMRSGAKEFLNSPIQIEELVGALDRVSVGGSGNRRNKTGSIISVAGASGGVGTTSIAINLACALAQDPQRSVVLVDLDLSLGDADVFLEMIPDYTLLDVAQNISRLDLALLRKSLTKHESGVYVLPRPIQIEDAGSISSESFKKVLGLLKASFTHLVIDLSKSYNELDLSALQASDHILMVTQLDLPCLRNIVRLLASFENYDGVNDKVRIVVNRAGLDKTQINASKAEETIDREIFWRIPNNYHIVAECRNNGRPLIKSAPKAAITLSINELANKLAGVDTDPEAADARPRKGWLPFLSK